LGALFGAILGIASALWSVAEYGGHLADKPLFSLVGFCVAVGAIGGGAVFESLSGWRKRGRLGYLLSWTVAVGAGAAIVATPSALSGKSLIDFIFVTTLGLVGGFGLGFVAEELRGTS
jgi:hypothetical protein